MRRQLSFSIWIPPVESVYDKAIDELIDIYNKKVDPLIDILSDKNKYTIRAPKPVVFNLPLQNDIRQSDQNRK